MRALFERVCRVVTVAALVLAALDLVVRAMGRGAFVGAAGSAAAITLGGDTTGASADSATQRTLVAFTHAAARSAGDSLAVALTGVPSAPVRAAMGAARAAKVSVRWRAPDTVSSLAVQVESASGAATGVVVRASRDVLPGQTPVRATYLRDDGGTLDSSAAASSMVRAWRLAQRAPGLAYTAPGIVARAAESRAADTTHAADRPRVLLVAAPGWEAKFATAALEESGWRVDGRLALSPSGAAALGDASRGNATTPRTEHQVLVLLDSVLPAPFAIDVRTLDRFVRRGGGVVFAGDALRSAAARALAPARTSDGNAVRGGVVGALRTPLPRLGLDAWRLVPLRDAIVLQLDTIDGRTTAPAVVVRRHGAGRVIAVAYRETWRWRMEGTDAGLAEHRAWWDRVLGAVASRAPSFPHAPEIADPYPGDAAPWADLVVRAGRPSLRASEVTVLTPQRAWPDRHAILFVVAALALLCEWTSRRLRGLP